MLERTGRSLDGFERRVATAFEAHERAALAPTVSAARAGARERALCYDARMWRRLEIRNFRSIAHASVDLGPFTVVVGRNGSGKSNFMDAIVFARDLTRDASTAIQSRGGITDVRRRRPKGAVDVTVRVACAVSRVALEAPDARHEFVVKSGRQGDWSIKIETIEGRDDHGHPFRVVREKTTAAFEPKAAGAGWQVQPQASALPTVVSRTRPDRSFSSLLRVVRYRLNPGEMRRPQVATERVRLDESGVNLAAAVASLRSARTRAMKERWQGIIGTMGKIIPGLRDIRVVTVLDYLVVAFDQEVDGEVAEFSAASMSEGALRALGILVGAAQMEDGELLIIEEPEQGVHPGAARVLFDHLEEASHRGAILVSTHSPELLDVARDEEILVADVERGITSIGPMDRAQRELIRDGLFTAAELLRTESFRIEGREVPTLAPESGT